MTFNSACAGYMTVAEDTAAFTAKAVLDAHTLNKRVHIRIPSNLLSQRNLISIWEHLAGYPVKTSQMTAEEVDQSVSGLVQRSGSLDHCSKRTPMSSA